MPVHHTARRDRWENGTHRPNLVRKYSRGQRKRMLSSLPSPCFPISHLTRTTRTVPVSLFLRSVWSHMCPFPTTRGERWYKMGHSPAFSPVSPLPWRGSTVAAPTQTFSRPLHALCTVMAPSQVHVELPPGMMARCPVTSGGWCHPDHETPSWLQIYPR